MAKTKHTADFDIRLAEARYRAEVAAMETSTNPPRIVAEDGTSRSVLDPHTSPLEARIAARPAPKVTLADIEAEIASEHYYTAADAVHFNSGGPRVAAPTELTLLTHCVLVLRNGFTVTGESACASPENFDADIGRDLARKAAVQKLWPLMGWSLRNEISGHRPMATSIPYVDKLPSREMVILEEQVAHDIQSHQLIFRMMASVDDETKSWSQPFEFSLDKSQTDANKAGAREKAITGLEVAFGIKR